jgi:dolichol-phosphate mannosyltransferase
MIVGARNSLCVVVPTRNESGNIESLVSRLDCSLGDQVAEILFVDDSTDTTPDRIREVASETARQVRLIHRTGPDRTGGLGGAVLAGMRETSADWVVVMDGDLQHPPEVALELVTTGIATGADVVVASRYAGSGSADGLASPVRARVSGWATTLAKAIFPRRLADCTDPMSGFFAVRTSSVDLDRLRPQGFKVLLEIFARTPRLQVAEVAFEFQDRHSGESKASLREGLLYARRLASLRAATVFGRRSPAIARMAGFAAVGATGILANSVALWFFFSVLHLDLLVSAVLSTQVSTSWNFVLTDRLVFPGAKRGSVWSRFFGFALVNNVVLLARLPLLSWLVHSLGVHYLLANVGTLVAAFALRFVLSDLYLFRPGAPMTLTSERTAPAEEPGKAERKRPVELVVDLRDLTSRPSRPPGPQSLLPFRYDVHGIVTIGSTVPLKELQTFRTAHLHGPLDIEIREGTVGDGSFRRRTRVTQYSSPPAVSYQEHFGRRGSDFHVDLSDRIQVVVGPMLVRSPHVLYTNVVEALLRFVIVSKGHMLLHSACLELNGRGVMLSALTDTGKTGTILRLLRENNSRFLSDDMTILSPDGTALAYPKPLTISQHTLRAVQAGDLTRKEWRKLRIQSRLHSKEGRGIGARLGEMNVPIMTMNALTQYVVPPPKYDVDRLVRCDRTHSVKVEELFIIERKASALSDIDPDGLVDELIANTDDAYGFPPFEYFAPALVVDGLGYEELRARERQILASALTGIRARRIATPDFSWADVIPGLTARDREPVLDAEISAPPPEVRASGRPE